MKLFFYVIASLLLCTACIPVDGVDQEPVRANNSSSQGTAKASEPTMNEKFAASQARIAELENEISQLRGTVDTLSVAVKTGQVPGKIAEEEIGGTQKTMGTRVNDVESTISELKSQIDILHQKLLSVTQQATPQQSNTQAAKAKSKTYTTKELEDLYKAKKYQTIVDNAETTLANATGSRKSKVLFLHAESLFNLDKHADAALKYDAFLKSNSNEVQDVALANLRLGDCFRKLGDKKTARVYYDEVVNRYKETSYAKTAQERIKSFF